MGPNLRSFLEGLPLPAWAITDRGELEYVNDAWIRFTGQDPVSDGAEWTEAILEGDRSAIDGACSNALLHGEPFQLEFQLRRADGQYRWLTCFASPYEERDGTTNGVVGMCTDLTEHRHREEQLAFMATHDALTGLPNRRMFEQSLERAILRSRRGEPGALLVLDIDFFKTYNDARGHLEGDQALINFALLLHQQLRAGDLLARIGGDEFAVLFERTSLDEAVAIAERMRNAAAREEFVAQARFHGLSMSAGLVPLDGDHDSRRLFELADGAMYEAKESGRNKVCVARLSEAPAGEDPGRTASTVLDALAEDRFLLYFQPVVRLADGTVEYCEALLRLRGRDGDIVLPDDFLSMAVRLGLMPRLTRRVVDLALTSLAQVPKSIVAVNVSAEDLTDNTLADYIEARAREAGADMHRLLFEVGEGALVGNLFSARSWMNELRRWGCRFVLDEFGAGLGLVALLKELPFDCVKLDASLTSDLGGDEGGQRFAEAVRGLIESQGLDVVASWIETQSQLDSITRAGFTMAQGFQIEVPGPDLDALMTRFPTSAGVASRLR